MDSLVKIIPIGGVSEIGSNMTIVQNKDSCFLIDCGILFPYDDLFDINYLIVNFDFLNSYPITDIVFTHGHEDHIGAVAHLVKKLPDIRIHCTQFCATLIRRRLEEQKITIRLNIIKASLPFKIGSLQINPIHVTHSIPETMALIIQNKEKDFSVLFMSDFKYDLAPKNERPFDIKLMTKIFNEGKIKIALLDSTNILHEKKSLSESDLVDDIFQVVKNAPGRLFVTLFSSNVTRMQTFIDAAKTNKRKICCVGRSINYYMQSARDVGLLQYDLNDIKNPDDIINDDDALVFTSGCQGDHFSALKRLAYGEHSLTKLKEGDTVVFSSMVIPGNEDKVYRIYNKITSTGAEIITSKDRQIHASGHACQEDLKQLISEIVPDVYIPIHGETFFLKRHHDFIKNNFPKIKPYQISNFTEINLTKTLEIKTKELQQHDLTIIHGNHIEIDRAKIAERRKIAKSGAVFITHGLPLFIDKELKQIGNLADKTLQKPKLKDDEQIIEAIKLETRRYLKNILGYKPVTIVHLN